MSTTADLSTSAGRFVKEFERWIPGPADRRAKLCAELEMHLLDAERSGRLEESLHRLGSPRDAALTFAGTTKIVPASLPPRIAAFFTDGCVLASGLPMLALTNLLCVGRDCPTQLPVRVALVWSVVVFFGVFTLMEWRYGATPGKMLAKIRVVDTQGVGISLRQAAIRRVPFVAMGPFQLIDQVFALFPPLHQRAFDRVAGTVVIDDRTTWRPRPADETARRDERLRMTAIASGWSATGLIVVTVAAVILAQPGAVALLVPFVCIVLAYVSLRAGFAVPRRDRQLKAGMIAGAVGLLPLASLSVLAVASAVRAGILLLPWP